MAHPEQCHDHLPRFSKEFTENKDDVRMLRNFCNSARSVKIR